MYGTSSSWLQHHQIRQSQIKVIRELPAPKLVIKRMPVRCAVRPVQRDLCAVSSGAGLPPAIGPIVLKQCCQRKASVP